METRTRRGSDDVEPAHSLFDFGLPEASTPLKLPGADSDNTTIFTSPIRRLNGLNLADVTEYKEHEVADDDFAEAEQTIADDLSDVEYRDDDDDDDDDEMLSSAPTYMNSKKRNMESPLDMLVVTPATAIRITTASGGLNTDMSCSFKLTNTDSTPCPDQPRKRLRMRNISPFGTPLMGGKRKNILNFSNSVKTSTKGLTNGLVISDLDGSLDDELKEKSYDSSQNDDFIDKSKTDASNNILVSTPISQSTPANSRAPSPPTMEEFGNSVNGYKFLRQKTFSNNGGASSQSTPQSEEMKKLYILQEFRTPEMKKYHIMGEIPVEAAGLMDENDEDVHIADKRINDPYLNGEGIVSPKNGNNYDINNDFNIIFNQDLRKRYLQLNFVPLSLVARSETLPVHEIIRQIADGISVREFYRSIVDKDETLLGFVRKDRMRWHPDKWVGNNTMDKDIIETLSQTLNALVDELEIEVEVKVKGIVRV